MKKKPKEDSIIEEVRRVRHELAAEFDFDIHKMFAHYREMEKTYPGKIADFSRKTTVKSSKQVATKKSGPKKNKPGERAS